MKIIKLPNGKRAIIDNDMVHLKQWKWCCDKDHYVRRSWKENGLTYTVLLHHAVIGRPLWNMQVDHINGNPLDNRKSNLRIVSCRENQWNKKNRRDGLTASRFIGVSARNIKTTNGRLYRYWQAKMYIGTKSIYLGCFKNEEDAGECYRMAIKDLPSPTTIFPSPDSRLSRVVRLKKCCGNKIGVGPGRTFK